MTKVLKEKHRVPWLHIEQRTSSSWKRSSQESFQGSVPQLRSEGEGGAGGGQSLFQAEGITDANYWGRRKEVKKANSCSFLIWGERDFWWTVHAFHPVREAMIPSAVCGYPFYWSVRLSEWPCTLTIAERLLFLLQYSPANILCWLAWLDELL